ncbi:polysaccharide deacetylase [Gordonia alkanivorans]|nr:polysaccharide deacetylase [Gordonia alkanivorans]MDH3026404.1 polysaccharide deacetylase [Gordonia alkanivorans]
MAIGRGTRMISAPIVVVLTVLLAGCATSAKSAVPETIPNISTTLSPAPPSPPTRVASNVPMKRLAPGEKPPQFILFSFDGVGVSKNWDLFLRTAAESDARFTALMTGLYFLTDAKKRQYRGPGYKPGEAAIGFGGSKKEVIEEITYLNRTWYDGHEMGTHFVGHFCAGTKNPGKSWTSAEWRHELAQFFRLMTQWRELNGIRTGPDLAFGPEAVKGARTQCLEGSMKALFPALRAYDMMWDSSMPASRPGVYWPSKINGIWEFPVPYVWSPALKQRQTALDYNFWYSVNKATDRPADRARIARVVTSTYDYMLRRAYEGNRAPLVIANHLNTWNTNAFNPATAAFMRRACTKPEVICATHQDVIAWMELQDPAVLKKWRSMAPVAVDAHH